MMIKPNKSKKKNLLNKYSKKKSFIIIAGDHGSDPVVIFDVTR